MVPRDLQPLLASMLERFGVVTLTGPRQSGKSTLCRATFSDLPYQTLESLDVRAFAASDPRGFLAQFPNGAVLDEIQHAPQLLSYLQAALDEAKFRGTHGARWVLTGSQNLTLLDSVGQSLAGRTAVLHLLPFSWNEIGQLPQPPATLDAAILAGGYPPPFDRGIPVREWISSYVATYVERDVRALTAVQDLGAFQSFLALCAGRTSQLLNLSGLAADAGIAQSTARAWLSILEATFLVFRLQPWFQNAGKRLVKSPKLHFYDTGLACWLLGIHTTDQLRTHPLRGALFETWVASEVLKHRIHRGELRAPYFYRDAGLREADLLVDRSDRRTIAEVKSGRTVSDDAILATRRVAEALPAGPASDRVVIFGGDESQARSDIRIIAWRDLHSIDWI